MAKKVFRIHNEGASNSDWFSSSEINHNIIESIHTDSGDGKKLPTSIPSPFARIDLVRTAFKAVAESGSLDGLERNGVSTATDNHKLISDALDIGQIFFNYTKLEKDLELEEWDKELSISKLINGNPKQKHLGKTLDLFLKQDKVQYNFDKFNKIYILKYKHKIIGGTSPRTLFFAAPNVKPTNIRFGQDIMLDNRLLPLYQRDKEYVKFLYSLSKSFLNFNQYFPEFNGYLIKTVDKISHFDSSLFDELNTMDWKRYLHSLKDVVFKDNAGQPLEIIDGLSLKEYVKDPAIIEKQSDFIINTHKEVIGLRPLVLPVDPFIARYTYTIDLWDKETEVPVEDKRPIDERTLPGQGDKYPYLTMNDFLEDAIIKLPYDMDSKRFLTVGSKKFLIPLKRKFFDYFNVEDIKKGNLIESTELAGDSVQIKLNIPIKKGFISFKKIYSFKNMVNQVRDPKKGFILENPFALSIYPFVTSDDIKITYAIGLANLFTSGRSNLNLSFHNSNTSRKIRPVNQSTRANTEIETFQTIVDEKFDIISLKAENTENIIIPNWVTYRGHAGDDYEFAIDFGTTNSHIEYKIKGQGSEKAFFIDDSEEQIVFLMPSNTQIRNQKLRDVDDGQDILTQEVISRKLGNNEERKMPFRTSLIQNKELNYNQPTSVFSHANIAFDYEKFPIRPYLKLYTDLKWAGNSDENNKRVEHYVEEMLMLCKNKVLMNNGNLVNTKVTWFYPVSMTSNHLRRLRNIWRDRYKKVFNLDLNNLSDFPESIAPFYYYKEKGDIRVMARPSVAIDIGGGTTDVMIFADGETKLITSFKFAGNAIFGDAFNGNINSNGFVKKFYKKIKILLTQNNLSPEIIILDKIFNESASSVDLINFFFSLKENKTLRDKKLDVDFSKMLIDSDEFKIVFLLFHSAIIYHIAEMMKIKGFESPRNVVYSGTGSKTLQILDSPEKYSSMTNLYKEIFNHVYNRDDSKISVAVSPNPKEITSKGGFYIDSDLDDLKHTELVEVNVGNIFNKKVQKTNNISNSIKYIDIDKKYLEGIVQNINNFFDLFIELGSKLNFKNEFGISNDSLNLFKKIKSDDLLNDAMVGLEILKSETTDEEPLGETLFFYPLIGKLNELVSKINSKS